MKLAVLIFGEYREFENAYKTWNFLNDIEHDIYISTWDKSYSEIPTPNIFVSEDVTTYKIKKIIPKAVINLEPDKTYGNNINVHKKMIYHWNKLFEMVDNSNVEYDNFLLIRTDVALKTKNFKTYIDNLDNNFLYGISPINNQNSLWFVQDYLFLGNRLLMNKLLKFQDTIDFIYSNDKDSPYVYHDFLAKHLIINNIIIKEMFNLYDNDLPIIGAFIMRYPNRFFLDDDWDIQDKVSEYWFKFLDNNSIFIEEKSKFIEVLINKISRKKK